MSKRWWIIGIAAAVMWVGGCGETYVPIAPPPVGCPDSMLSTTTVPTDEFRPDFIDMVALPVDWDEDALIPTGGSFRDYLAPQILGIRLADDTVNPDARIMEIAENHSGVVVGLGTAPGYVTYSVRFCGYGLEDLIELARVLEEEDDDVIFAGPWVRQWETPNL
ncbi:MAG: hypothetical protein GY925_15440 [Actinomycetia bacterium]|nr:hypothetical protein [Actinomycetes bacterium]